MDIQAAKRAIQDITSVPALMALKLNIEREISIIPHNDLIDDEMNPLWEEMVEIGALIACQLERCMPAWNAQMRANGTEKANPCTFDAFFTTDDKWYNAANWHMFTENWTIGAEAALYDEKGNEDISDMLPVMATNPIYS